MFVFVSNYEVA